MKCEIVSYNITVSDNFNTVGSSTRAIIKCNAHNMMDFAPAGYENMLCPIGQIEAAVDAGLAKISAALADTSQMEFQAQMHSAELMLRDIEIKHLRSQLPVTNNEA